VHMSSALYYAHCRTYIWGEREGGLMRLTPSRVPGPRVMLLAGDAAAAGAATAPKSKAARKGQVVDLVAEGRWSPSFLVFKLTRAALVRQLAIQVHPTRLFPTREPLSTTRPTSSYTERLWVVPGPAPVA
jgi:hypothetical protein